MSRLAAAIEPLWSKVAWAKAADATGAAAAFQENLARTAALSQEAAYLIAFLLKPTALIAFAMGGWRFCADLGWTGDFVIAGGLFSHWQVWIALGFAISAVASAMGRLVSQGSGNPR